MLEKNKLIVITGWQMMVDGDRVSGLGTWPVAI